VILYVDSSALIKLHVEEAGSAAVEQALAQAETYTTSVLAYVETRSALARKRRDGSVTETEYANVVQTFEADWERLAVVNLTPALVRRAGDGAEEYGLKALDAVHLASALWLRDTSGSPTTFLCADRQLARAALAAGLQTELVGA